MNREDVIRQAESLLERAGSLVSLETGENFFAFILPEKPSQTPDGLRRPLGREETARFTYYGPGRNGGELVKEGDLLRQGERSFRVLWIRDWTLGDRTLLRWGALMSEEGDAL